MPTLTIDYQDEGERLALEQAIAYLRDLRQLAIDAPAGTVLEACEGLALEKGRALLRSSLAAALGSRVALAEQKGGTLAPAPERTPASPRGRIGRTILTALGPLTLVRRYFDCPTCDQGDFGADRVLGIEGYVTRGACRMACLLGVQRSFEKAEPARLEVAGWDLDDNTIRRLCHATAARAGSTRERRQTAEAFAQAAGDLEVQIDAGKINTTAGWRDLKVAVLDRREPDEPISPAEWDERDLPAPSVRSVVAAVEEAALFGERCAAEARRLGLDDPRPMSVLGDGAEWIWNLADRHFDGASQCLDFWHAAGHLGDGARVVFGSGGEAEAALDRGKKKLLEDGYCGVVEWVGELGLEMPAGGDDAGLGPVLNYFAGHQGRVNYVLRLRRGQSIGSGLVEGSIKQLLNVRLKQTGARWRVEHVAPLVELGAMAAGPEWEAFWKQK